MAWREKLNNVGEEQQELKFDGTLGWRCCARWALAYEDAKGHS